MIVILTDNDLNLPDFPHEILEHARNHAQFIVTQTNPDSNEPDAFTILKSVYYERKNKIDKNTLINYINKII